MDSLRLHPSEKDLLLYVDGELPRRQAARIDRHLATCWECRAHLARTESTIDNFVTVRRKLLDAQLQGTEFPPARASRAMLGAHLAEIARTAPLGATWPRLPFGWFRTVVAVHRPASISAALAVAAGLFLVVNALLAPRITAAEVIANGQAAERRMIPRGAVLHQRLRIRHKPHTVAVAAATTADYDLWQDARRSRLMRLSGRSEPSDRLRTLYQSRGANWTSPLSVSGFASLRASLGAAPRDEVRGRNLITLISTPDSNAGGELKRIELTVRSSDWHAISERIELSDAEFEVTELLDEVVSSEKVDPAVFVEQQAQTAQTVAAAPAIEPAVAPAPASAPPVETPESAEVRVREALHQTWADIEEVPEIRREDGRIRVRAFAQTARRQQEIAAALAGIPHLDLDIQNAETSPPESSVAQAGSALPAPPATYFTKPPLAKALREYSGGLEPANNYINAVQDSYLQVQLDASALARLAERYSEGEWNRLSPESQERLNRIAADHIAAVRNQMRNYIRLVSPALDEMSSQQHVEAAERGAAQAGCVSWRSAAQPFVSELRILQSSFRRLFVEEQSERPVEVSAVELLRQSIESRARLRQYELCRP